MDFRKVVIRKVQDSKERALIIKQAPYTTSRFEEEEDEEDIPSYVCSTAALDLQTVAGQDE